MYNYYFIQNIEIKFDMHGESLMSMKCISMFYIRFKMNTRFLFHHSSNPTEALSQDHVIGIFKWTYMKSIGKSTLACLIFDPN